MAEISKITLPSGTTYDIKDAEARELISALSNATHWLGTSTTAISDGATTNPVTIDGTKVTAASGDIVAYSNKEFIFNGTKWQEFGSTGALKALAFKDTASATYTPAGSVSQPTFTGNLGVVTISTGDHTNGNYLPKGTVSQPTFTGSELTSTGKFTPSGTVSVTSTGGTNTAYDVSPASTGTATYTPAGSVAAPTISVKTAGSTTTVNSITAVGTLPTFGATVANENLTLSFSQGSLPTKGANVTVKTGDAAYEATAPAFTGTGVRLRTAGIPVVTSYSATFTGTEGDVSVSGTPAGTVSRPTFSGTRTEISGTLTPTGTVSQPTFSGTQATITVS